MTFNNDYQSWLGWSRSGRRTRATATPRSTLRPRLEELEDRTLPSNLFAATVLQLIHDINAANNAGGTNTITLAANATFTFTKVDDTTDGATGLPPISAGDALTIVGNGDTIERSTTSGTPAFRLFDVASGASLTLESLTLQNGLAFGSGSSSEGGAAFNQGTLTLSGVTVQDNLASGANGMDGTKNHPNGTTGENAFGGGIYSNGALTVENGSVIQNNSAVGGDGGSAYLPNSNSFGGEGGSAWGGGLYVAGSGTMAGDSVLNNLAAAGNPGLRGAFQAFALGGGIFVLPTSTVTLSNDIVESNAVTSPGAGVTSEAWGGGIFIDQDALHPSNGTVTLINDVVDDNTASAGAGIFIFGTNTVTLCNDTVEHNTAAGSAGGIAINEGLGSPITVFIDSFTVANTINNTDSSGLNGSTANIDGTYIFQNC